MAYPTPNTLADATLAFQTDLVQLGVEDRVIGMTFSEFGRRVQSNDNYLVRLAR